jgi:isoquinoline 1-oxidoreductase beta subunit
MVAPPLYRAARLRDAVKTVFIRIDVLGAPSIIIPYVELEAEAIHCAAALVGGELSLSPGSVIVDNRVVDVAGVEKTCIIDLGNANEFLLAVLAATARSLLAAAAAELWSVTPDNCALDSGLILERHGTRALTYGEATIDAALLPLPASVTLRSRESVAIRP